MTVVTFESSTFELEEHESVLDCLLRNAQQIPYACKAGMCQACLIKAEDGHPPETAKKWIKASLQEKGYCLSCQWVPDSDVAVSLPSVDEFSIEANISSLELLNPHTLKVLLKISEQDKSFICKPGQYLTLINPEGIARSYSIANNYDTDHHLELHIGKTSQGLFTNWLFNLAKRGDKLHLRGPAGDCFYTKPDEDPFPLLLAGTGTGLAPLFGILNEALNRNHQGPIYLYHGSRHADGLYYVDVLNNLSEVHANFHYTPIYMHTSNSPTTNENTIVEGDITETVCNNLPLDAISKTQAYLCGNPDFVHNLRKQLFLKGTKSSNIYCDPFLERAAPTTAV